MRLLLARVPPRCARCPSLARPPSFQHSILRLQSSKATASDEQKSQATAQRPATRALFAIEHIHGRARHLSWSGSGGIEKEWRELGGRNDDTKAVTASSRFSPLGRLTAWLRQMFLPTNYPQSVHPSYLKFHLLQFMECIVGTVVGVLCNQALLVSVGVSAEGSILGAVAVQWVIKDGAGEVAKLWVIRRFSPYFDSHPKTFTFTGATMGLLGSGLQIAALVVPPTTLNFLLCAAGGNIFKCVGGAVWLTTHIKFVRFFARQGNMGDVAAKSESQGSVGILSGYAAGVGLLTVSHSAPYLYTIFALAIPIHLLITQWMLRAATFELLTLPRLSFLAREFASRASRPEAERELPTLGELERQRAIGVFGEYFKTKEDQYVQIAPDLDAVVSPTDLGARTRWDACVEAFNDQPYLLYPYLMQQSECKIAVLLHPSATVDDRIQSVLHAAFLQRHLHNVMQIDPAESTPQELLDNDKVLKAALDDAKRLVALYLREFKTQLVEKEWRTDEIAVPELGRRVLWGTAAIQKPKRVEKS
ncbi:uncharacterized protein PHACADRAFT_251666 [Phanerochaete carnosa HHB-10118-sp]|uniref:DUF647-domain-containing protein n=1 Tax=Phanerochaete carnosa (strain HHB-10118-sp) TaxID=650164 RepID=K5WFI5_PHACS|nr:uncharacterized protein PHACADRAFT_251666 [Phanerochaete carnosa HHB-10118-sp]EKM57809.1 hypothetical protein PHACADRAFT_251666 [Phanerochaete carnosa HHB-10118-sp]